MGNRVSRITDAISRRKRKETGQDPVDGCVDYEDRFYNNASFKRGAGGSTQTPASETAHSTAAGQSGENAISPDENDAAIEIQAGYKGYKARKEVKEMKNVTADTDANNSAIKKDNDIDIDLTDPEVSAAATKIQANFRGHHTRQKLKDTPQVIPSSTDEEQHPEPAEEKGDVKTEPEEIDIDLTDPEVEAAAQKIQASFRGHLKSKRNQTISKEEESEEKETIASSEKAHIEKDSSAVGGSLTISSKGVQKGDDKEVSEVKEKEEEEEEKEEEEVIDMKPAEQTAEKVREHSGSVSEGDKANKNEDGSTAEGTEVKKEAVPAEKKAASTTAATPQPTEAEEVDIDLTDPDVAAATKKLQAGFRGRLNRRKKAQENALAAASTEPPSEEAAMSQKSNDGVATFDDATTGDQGQKDDKSINYKDPQVHLAAAEVQAGFKGYQTRKSLKKQAGNSEEAEKDSGS